MTHSFWQQLDKANDEQDVRRRIAEGLYNQPALGIAQEWLRRKDEERAKQRQSELVAEIKRPHWSVTPSFCLLVASVLLSAAALAVAIVGLPQAKQSGPSTVPIQKAPPSVGDSSSNSQPQLPHSQPSQTQPTQK